MCAVSLILAVPIFAYPGEMFMWIKTLNETLGYIILSLGLITAPITIIYIITL
jgi:hypothetical protein